MVIGTLVTNTYGALYITCLVLLAILLAILVLYHEHTGRRPGGAEKFIAGVPVPRTRPFSQQHSPQRSSEQGGVELRTHAPAAGGLRPRSVSFGGAAARGENDLHVACTVVPPTAACESPSGAQLQAPPPSPPPSPSPSGSGKLPAEVQVSSIHSPAGEHRRQLSTDLAPQLRDATTVVAGARTSRASAGSSSSSRMEAEAAKSPSPNGVSSVGLGFGGGDVVAPRKRSWLDELMPFAYPVILGCLETLVQMCQKAASSMAFLTISGQSQLCHPNFWIAWLLLASLTVLVIWWLRKGLSHLEASRLLPIEYGTVTSTAILGGLIIFQEHRFVSTFHLWMMLGGILLICIGCALVGRRKTIQKKFDVGYKFNHEVLPRIKEEIARSRSFQPRLHAQHHRRTASAAPLCASSGGGGGLREQKGSPPIDPMADGAATRPGEVRVTLESVAENSPPVREQDCGPAGGRSSSRASGRAAEEPKPGAASEAEGEVV